MSACPYVRAALFASVVAAAGCVLSFEPEQRPASAPESQPPSAPQSAEPALETVAIRQRILETALGQLGRPYVYGGGDGEGFDCSGLVKHVYADAGVALPRTAAEQSRTGHNIALADAVVGDLLFFRIKSGIHVTIYVGDGRVVHAPAPGKDVRLADVTTPYWQQRFHKAVNLLH